MTPLALIPASLTLANAACGATAAWLALTGRPHEACWFLLFGCVFDGSDGKVARWLGAETPAGRQMDVAADFISFGMAPAALVGSVAGETFALAWGVALLYTGAAAFRLARFYFDSTVGTESPTRFKGYPSTAAAGTLACIALGFLDAPRAAEWLTGSAVALAVLMAGRLPYCNPRSGFSSDLLLSCALAMGSAGIGCLFGFLAPAWKALAIAGFVGYAVSPIAHAAMQLVDRPAEDDLSA